MVILHQGIYHIKTVILKYAFIFWYYPFVLNPHYVSSSFLFLPTKFFSRARVVARIYLQGAPTHNACRKIVCLNVNLCSVLKSCLDFRETCHLRVYFLSRCGESSPFETAVNIYQTARRHVSEITTLSSTRFGNLTPASRIISLSNNSPNNIMCLECISDLS